MLEELIKSGGSELMSQLGSKFNLNSTQGNKVVDVTTDVLKKGITKEVTSGNFDGILSLLNGKSSSAGSALTNSLTESLVAGFISKVGLSKEVSGTIAKFVIPFLMSKLAKNKPAGGFNAASLMQMVQGSAGDAIKDKAGDLLKGGLGNLFK